MYNFSSKPFILCKLTNACNQKCIHCYTDACAGGITQLKSEQVIDLLEDIEKINKDSVVSFIGGEATVWKDFFEVISIPKYKSSLYLKVNTNGTALKEQSYDKFADSSLFETRISLDYYYNSKHDYFRGNGTFDKAVNTIKELKKRGLTVTTGTVISRLNFKEINEIIQYFLKLGIEVMHFFPFLPQGRGKEFIEFTLSDDENTWVKNEIKKYQKKPVCTVPCDTGTCYFSVTFDGKCYLHFPDNSEEKKIIGSLNEKRFLDIYQEVYSPNDYNIVDCSQCAYYKDPIMCKNMHTFCIADLDLREGY
ncbi:MAG: hypothetical protein A2Y40_06550 [Candidatus Margulisbacteria bacterium GWF2_35_9]|nr:MAG: hypothetical protein A2Y40_06550 [Candidatus Margulisbacteria bacterium GWF2_35_9]